MERYTMIQYRGWLALSAILLGCCATGLAGEPNSVTPRGPAPVSLPSGWFSEGAGAIRLAAHDAGPSPLPSSRRNAAERLDFIRRSVIVDGVSASPDLPSAKPATTTPPGQPSGGLEPLPMALPADAEIAGAPAANPAPNQVAAPAATAQGTESPVGPVASLPHPPSAIVPSRPQELTAEAMDELTDSPIVDRGTSQGVPARLDSQHPSRNPVRQSPTSRTQEIPTESMEESTPASSPSVEPTLPTQEPAPVIDATPPVESGPKVDAPHDAPPAVTQPIAEVTPPVASPTVVEEAANDTLFASQSPALSFSTHGPRTIVVGKPATYVVRMTNSGGVAAEDVDIKVQIPAWADVLKTRPTSGTSRQEPAEDDRSVVRWQLDELAAQHAENLEITLIPRTSQPFELGVGWNFAPARGLTQIQVQEPRLELSVMGPREVLYGEKKVYTLTVSNPGTGDAENVTLQLLPIVPTERTGAIRKLGTLAPGAREVIELELTARQAGTLEVKAIAAAEGNLHVTAAQEVVVRRANLEVKLEGPPSPYFAGTAARYTARITNSGDATATEVMAAVRLPAGAREVAASRGGRWDESQGTVHWQVGPLRAGDSKVVQVQCDLMAAGENRLEARASGAGDLAATDSIVTNVESLADLKLTVNDPKGVVPLGTDALYEVRIMNRGTKAAEDIRLVGYFSEGIEPISIEGWRGQIEEGQVVMQPIRRLQAGQEMVIKITARASKEANHVFRAELDCADPETRLATEEWTRYFGQAVSGEANAEEVADVVEDNSGVQVRR